MQGDLGGLFVAAKILLSFSGERIFVRLFFKNFFSTSEGIPKGYRRKGEQVLITNYKLLIRDKTSTK